MTYRIYTEDLKSDLVAGIVSQYFDGFTMYHAQGYWKGTFEGSLVIEIITDNQTSTAEGSATTIGYICKQIKRLNKQSSILVQKFQNDAWMV